MLNKNQAYPKWQLPMEKYQLLLNKASVHSDMKTVGKYNVMINKLWDKYHQNN